MSHYLCSARAAASTIHYEFENIGLSLASTCPNIASTEKQFGRGALTTLEKGRRTVSALHFLGPDGSRRGGPGGPGDRGRDRRGQCSVAVWGSTPTLGLHQRPVMHSCMFDRVFILAILAAVQRPKNYYICI